MTIQELRIAFNEACRKPQDLEYFAQKIMPDVFKLMDAVLNGQDVPKPVRAMAKNILSIELPPKKQPDPARYCGGR